ncbi:MAG: hypothetical protein PHS16_01990 [Candidatus Colwellbacteria bacterium]|jgi:hypothetical protein|nr:hypothetical protein [Candidatus Colwellbacteria bacterium]MCK9497711.1 hypothetical protein [Candidatus Colwellbacteria bacterium]MDD3752687.1 hypothetical protein [Candidatus Colwellbacteria bacterium]MDD4818836.1 hypothetical protein [Candidatus Colwellbacteria bacterium]
MFKNNFKNKTFFSKKAVLLIFVCVIPFLIGFFATVAYAATNIDPTYPNYFAWSDTIGWIDFYSTDSVDINNNNLEGYARFGPEGGPYNYISLDCATGPSGSDCSVPYQVTNDGNGNLSGWAWSDALGWISFDCHNPETGGSAPDYSCAQSLYQTEIDAQGNFTGWAWNDVAGWISFNCNQDETGDQCAISEYRVKGAWTPGPVKGILESGTFDTDRESGVAFNYIVWVGELNGGRVSFQFATSDCSNGATNAPACDANIGWGGKASGDGAFLGPAGTSVETDIYIPSGPSVPVEIRNQDVHNNKRFFRYKIFIETDAGQTGTPVVQDVIVNWSP